MRETAIFLQSDVTTMFLDILTDAKISAIRVYLRQIYKVINICMNFQDLLA